MSYRQCRNLCEMLRSLNYPRLISLQNFTKPNFELVADILYWLAQKYDPQMEISDDINQEKDRVQFIKTIVTLFSTKARIKLNPKKLYQSDCQAVQEILKIVVLLYKASNSKGVEEEQTAVVTLPVKVSNLKSHKILANQICQLGTKLYDSIGKQPQLKKIRVQALKFLDGIYGGSGEKDQAYIEKCVKQIMQQQNQNMTEMNKYVVNMEKQQKNLEEKLKKKSAELQRAEKRYKSLIGVKPAFMEEFQRLEQELEGMYQIYVEKYRNINYLEEELQRYNKAEEEKLAKAKIQLQKIHDKIKKQAELDLLQVDELDDGLLEPQNQRGFTRLNSRKNEKAGGGGKEGDALGEREEEEQSDGNEQGNSEEQESGEDLEDEDDDNF